MDSSFVLLIHSIKKYLPSTEQVLGSVSELARAYFQRKMLAEWSRKTSVVNVSAMVLGRDGGPGPPEYFEAG